MQKPNRWLKAYRMNRPPTFLLEKSVTITQCRIDWIQSVVSDGVNSHVGYGWGSISLGRQVLSNQGWVGWWSRRSMFQPLPGIV